MGRKKSDYPKYGFAHRLGTSNTMLSKYITGVLLPSPKMAVRWGKAIGVKPWVFIFEESGAIRGKESRRKLIDDLKKGTPAR